MARNKPKARHRGWLSSNHVPAGVFVTTVMIGTLALGGAAILAARQVGLTDRPEFTASANLWPAIGILLVVALLVFSMAVSVVSRQRRLRRIEGALSAGGYGRLV